MYFDPSMCQIHVVCRIKAGVQRDEQLCGIEVSYEASSPCQKHVVFKRSSMIIEVQADRGKFVISHNLNERVRHVVLHFHDHGAQFAQLR